MSDGDDGADLRLLVLDCYDRPGRDGLARAQASLAGPLYERMLRRHAPKAHIDVLHYDDGGFRLPAGGSLTDYDGVAWTGSNLTVHKDEPAVRDQLAFARAAFDAGVPQFGSCWAVHVAVTVSGGACEANPKGREFGLARKVTLNEAGRAHPMFDGKPHAFDGFTSHEDHVVTLGPGTTVLASNEFSPVQAVHVEHARGTFWAVQYHPEYDLYDLARLCIARAEQLLRQRFFRDPSEVETYVAELETLHEDRERIDLAWRHGMGDDVLDPGVRTLETGRWLEHQVRPNKR